MQGHTLIVKETKGRCEYCRIHQANSSLCTLAQYPRFIYMIRKGVLKNIMTFKCLDKYIFNDLS